MYPVTVKPRIAITVGDPAGIGPEIAGKAAADPAVRAVCEPVIYETAVDVAMGQVSGEAGPGRLRHAGPRRRRRPRRPRRRHRHRAGQQGGVRRRRPAVEGSHRPARPPVRRAPGGDDVPRADAEGGAGHRARRAARRPGDAHPRAHDRDDRPYRPRAARGSAWPRRGWRSPPSTRMPARAGSSGPRTTRCWRRPSPTPAPPATTSRGPIPADTVFVRATRGEFDCVIACYHDQGLVPVKLLAFGSAVNVTLGLPIIRTSVDHGTAFDIAGQGVADPGSLVQAVRLAADLAARRVARPVSARTPPPRAAGAGGQARRPAAHRREPQGAATTTTSSRPSRPACSCSAPR